MIWDDVRFVLAVHRFGSLSGAARALKVNQSTVGRRIAALEATCKARLFFHGGEGYELSAVGQRLLPRMLKMEEDALGLARELEGADEALSGDVALTGPDAFAAVAVVPILSRFHAHFPQIRVELICEQRALDLRQREADLALRIGRPRESALVVRRLAALSFAVYASQSYIAMHGAPRPQLDGQHVVGVQRAISEGWLAKHGRAAQVVLRTNSTTAHVNAVAAGLGFGVLPCYLARAEPSLVQVAPSDASLTSSLWLAVHRDLRAVARMRALADTLVAELARRRY